MKYNFVFLFPIVFFLPLWLNAQIQQGGTPYSLGSHFKKQFSNKKSIQATALPAIDWEKVRQEDAQTINSRRFAYPIEVNLNPHNAGEWFELENGDRLWQLKVSSKDAKALRVIFDKFWLPNQARLFIFDENYQQILGAFTNFNNQQSKRFGTDLIFHHTILIEYYEPKEVKGLFELNIWRIDHAYRENELFEGFGFKKGNTLPGFGQSEPCNININCSSANDWQNEKRGVVMVVLTNANGSGFCTASLINNTALNSEPYILCAKHCEDDDGQGFVDTWVFLFNYESPTCANPSTEPSRGQSIGSANIVAGFTDSDFLLLRLEDNVPAEYDAYFNGWDRTGVENTQSISIHHPDGDIKKISFDNNTSVTSTFSLYPNVGANFFKVVWDENTLTEAGSSGSPLFNQNKKIVGVLTGGDAGGCSKLNFTDFYGKLSVSWNGGGTPQTRLSDWLDPLNTNATTLDGKENVIPQNDLAVTAILLGATPCEYTNSTNMQATISNRGTENQQNISVTYQLRKKINNELVSSGTLIINALNTNAANTLNFSVNLAESNTEFVLTVEVILANDQNTSNNTKNIELNTLNLVNNFPYIQNFENDNGGWFSGGVNNDWEWGTPNGTFIRNALGSTRAWVTNLDGNYRNFSDAYLQSPIFNLSNLESPYFSADIFVHTEEDYDGVQLQASTDCGETWERVGNVGEGINWYNNDEPIDLPFEDFGNQAWSKSSDNEWLRAEISLEKYAQAPSVLFRFLFRSDFSETLEGFGADNIRIFNNGSGTSSGNQLNDLIIVHPNPTYSDFFIIDISRASTTLSSVILVDYLGRKILEKDFDNIQSRVSIPTNDLAEGIYLVKITTEKGIAQKKILINRP